MINTNSQASAYQTLFSTRQVSATADAPIEKGGQGAGFGPHELLEAALATCINMAVRMRADQLGILLTSVTAWVSLDRSQPEVVTFKYQLHLEGTLSSLERQQLEAAADACPVRQTLMKKLEFTAIHAEFRP